MGISVDVMDPVPVPLFIIYHFLIRCTISIRDYLSWTQFINRVIEADLKITVAAAVNHGACLAFLDGLGSGATATEK